MRKTAHNLKHNKMNNKINLKGMSLLLLLVVSAMAKAQTHEFAPVGAEWYYGTHEMFSRGYIKMHVEKDTIIDELDCIKLGREKYWYDYQFHEMHSMSMTPEFLAYVNDSCMFFRNGQWHKLYDFSAEVGDTVTINGLPDNVCMTNICKVLITGKGSEMVNGVLLKYFEMKDTQDSDWGWSGTIVGDETEIIRVYERIGAVASYFFPEQRCLFDYAEGGVLRCYEDKEIGYLNYTYPYTECDFITDVEEHFNEQSIMVYPNPCKEVVFVDFGDAYDKVRRLEVFDMMGSLMFTSTSDEKHFEIAMNQFAQGVYLLKATTKRNTLFITIIKNNN